MAALESAMGLVGSVSNPKIKAGFWSCCLSKPTKAIRFDDQNGNPVWYQACAGCASTVSPGRVRELATLVERDAAEGRELAREAEARAVAGPLRDLWHRLVAWLRDDWTPMDERWVRIVALVAIALVITGEVLIISA